MPIIIPTTVPYSSEAGTVDQCQQTA